MRINKKLKAFTIVELLIGILISSIVIGIAISSYIIIGSGIIEFKDSRDYLSDVERMDYLIKRDFTLSKKVQKTNDGFLVKYPNERELKYFFSMNMLIRDDGGIKDTVEFDACKSNMYFGEKAQESKGGLIEKLNITAQKKANSYAFYYWKEYDAMSLLELNR